jgi:hypothetical protein
MMFTHERKMGDHYGLSCDDCGAPLEGYGCGGEGDGTCHHRFVPHGSESKVCVYGERVIAAIHPEVLP